jgi:menaquinone-dependent protoporphyrinogen oxidase
MNVLIAYGTTDGHTAKIAGHMATTARNAGHAVKLVDTKELPRDLDVRRFDAVVVGGSMHVQGYQRAVKRFVRRNLDALRTRPSAFFSVCLSIESRNPDERAAARAIAERFPASCGWLPERIETIAGALLFSRYGFLRRRAMIAIARKELGAIDPRRDHVYTDWEQVDRFIGSFVEGAHSRAA